MSNELANSYWNALSYTSAPIPSGDAPAYSQSVHDSLAPDNQTATAIDHNIVSTTDAVSYNNNRLYTELQPAGLSTREPHSFHRYLAQDSLSLQVNNGENNCGHLQPAHAVNIPPGRVYAAPQALSYGYPTYRVQSSYHPEQQAQQYGYQERSYGLSYRPATLMYSHHQSLVQHQPQLQSPQHRQPLSSPMFAQNQQPMLYQQQIPPSLPHQAQYPLNQPCQQPYRSQFTYSQPPHSTHSYMSTETTPSASPSNRKRRVTQSRSLPRNVSRSRSRKPNTDQASSTPECSNTASEPLSPPRSCVVCENLPDTNKLGPYLCGYCLSVYQTSVLLGQENCSCSYWPASQNDLDHLKFCWKCIVLKCVANGVRKEAVETNQPCSTRPVPFDLLPRLLPSPKCSQEFITPLAIVTALDPLPEGRPLLSVVRDSSVLQKSSTESVINVILWTNEIPLFADFSIENRTEILKSALLPLLLVRFVFKLASVVPRSRPLADIQPPALQVNSENMVDTKSVFKVLFGSGLRDDEFVFTMEEMEALNNSMEIYESRLIAYLCSAAFQPSEQSLPVGEIELNRMPLYQRAALRRLFKLALVFKRLNLSEIIVSCLSLVLLFDNERVEVPEDIKENMKKRRAMAKQYLRCTFDKVNQVVGVVDFYKLLSYIPEIRNLTEELTLASDEMSVQDTPSGINFVGLKNILIYIYPDYLKERMNA